MICPLCLKECIYVEDGEYNCPTLVLSSPAYSSRIFDNGQSHYSLTFIDTEPNVEDALLARRERAIVLPYSVANYWYPGREAYSEIFILKERPEFYLDMMEDVRMEFSFVAEAPPIRMDTEEKLLQRLKILVMLS